MRAHLPLTLRDMLENNASLHTHSPAFISSERRISHGELLPRARQLGSALERAGVHHQDRIAILSMNSVEYGEVLSAGFYSGIIIATLNFRLAAPELLYQLSETRPRVLIFEAQYQELVAQLRAQLDFVETYICIGGDVDWAQRYENFLAQGDVAGPSFTTSEEDIALLVHTGGTTGKPKACIWGQRETRMLARLMNGEQQSGPVDRGLLVMPMFHIGALAIMLGLHFRGGCAVLQKMFEPTAYLNMLEQQGVTLLHLAPTMVQMLLEHPAIGQTKVDSVRTVVYSAAVMPTPVLRRGLEIFGNVFTNLYGQTEVVTSGLVKELHRPHGSEREQNWLNSIGHPFPDTFVRIVDDHGNEVARGEPGEIQVRSTVMARGYWNNDIATIETFRDGWCHTGDVGRVDEDGFLYLVDRKKDVIISGGENIYSREVEEAVLQHPAVSECAVVGVPDEKWGESVCAVVVLRAGKTASADEIIAHTKALIASYKKPKFVEIVSELPKFPTGKINKVELRRQFAAHS